MYDNKSIDLSPQSPKHRFILDALNARFRLSVQRMQRLHDKWRKAEEQFIAFLPEREVDAARRNLREKGKPQYTTVVLPYTYAMLMSAHSYWTTVFLSRSPVFQYSGRHGETVQQTQALEALIDYQLQQGKMLVPLYYWLLDMGKYGIGILANYWCEEVSTIASYKEFAIPNPLDPFAGIKTQRQLVREQVRGYSGSKVINIRPYDYFPDPRVPLWDVQRGEFVSYLAEMGLNELLRGQAQGRYINVDYVKQKAQAGLNSTGREQGSSQVELPNDGSSLDLIDQKDTRLYGVVTMYVDLIPSEWQLGSSNYPEKWVFTTITSGGTPVQGQATALQVIIGAQPLGNYHNKFPIHVQEFEPEAYAFASRSMPQVMEPMQNTIDWLLNSHMYNVRKTLNNQVLIDPSRVVMKDFLEPTAGGLLRLKPAAYGTDPKSVASQLPIADVTAGHIRDIQFFHDFTQRAIGVNDQIMGLIDTGGRKTAQEVRSSSTFGVNRQKTIAELASAMGWAGLAEMLVQESQQYFDAPLKLRIVGDLAQEAGMQFVNVDPETIQGFYDFVPVDGTMPIDRFAQANLWKEIIANIVQVPQIAGNYDIGRIFAWTAQLAGLKNINQFKVQVLPPGVTPPSNVVPMPAGRQDLGRVGEPAQIPMMGTTA